MSSVPHTHGGLEAELGGELFHRLRHVTVDNVKRLYGTAVE